MLEVYVTDGSPFAGDEHYLPMTHESQIKIYDNDVVVSGNIIRL